MGIEQWCKSFGKPKNTLTDLGPFMQGGQFQTFCVRNNISEMFTTAGFHKSNGITQRYIKALTDRVRKLLVNKGIHSGLWHRVLKEAIECTRLVPNRITGEPPIFLLRHKDLKGRYVPRGERERRVKEALSLQKVWKDKENVHRHDRWTYKQDDEVWVWYYE